MSAHSAFIAAVGPNGLLISDWQGEISQALPRAGLKEGEAGFESVAISLDSQTIAAGNDIGDFYLWRLNAAGRLPLAFSARDDGDEDQETAALAFHPDNQALAIAISADGEMIATGGEDRTVLTVRLCDCS